MPIFTAGIVWEPREPLPPECSFIGTQGLSHSIGPKTVPDNTIKGHTRNVLPPESISIDGRIIHDTAKVTISQVFWNNADIPLVQASYVFPLPSGCSVTSFSCRINRDKILRAQVQPKKDAQKAFQKAIEAHQVAALLEQNTPEIFTGSLGSIPANTRVEAELTYITLLKRHISPGKSITTFTVPTAIATRFGKIPDGIPQVASQKGPHTFALQLEVVEAEKILVIKSETHKIILDRGFHEFKVSKLRALSMHGDDANKEAAMVRLDLETGFLDEDFVLVIEKCCPGAAEHPQAWLESHPSLHGQKAMMITIPSSFMIEEGRPSTQGEILFLVDRSGSMADKIVPVKSSLRFFLKGIPIGRTFNILSFGSRYEKLWAESELYSEKSLQTALEYVDREVQANMGGTELLDALNAALQERDAIIPCDVIILTDGEVWRLDETLSLVQKTTNTSRGMVRFFSLGIGSHVSHALVQGIASRDGGYSEIIPNASAGGWEDRVVAMLKAALTNHAQSLELRINDKADYGEFLTSPVDIESLNPFQERRIFLLSRADASPEEARSITIEAIKCNGERVCTAVRMKRLTKNDVTIHSLAARAILEDLEYALDETRTKQTLDEKRGLNQAQAEDLACRFSLISKMTSFFLQQDNNEHGEGNYAMCTVLPVCEASEIFGSSASKSNHSERRVTTFMWHRDDPTTPMDYKQSIASISGDVFPFIE